MNYKGQNFKDMLTGSKKKDFNIHILQDFTEFGLNKILNDFMCYKNMSEDDFCEYLKQVMQCQHFSREGTADLSEYYSTKHSEYIKSEHDRIMNSYDEIEERDL